MINIYLAYLILCYFEWCTCCFMKSIMKKVIVKNQVVFNSILNTA